MLKRIGCLLVVSLALGVATMAQASADAYVGYIYTRQNYFGNTLNLNGGDFQITVYPARWFGIVGEVTGSEAHSIDGVGTNGALFTYMGGPRISFRYGPVQPYVQALFGGATVDPTLQANIGASSPNTFASAVGGGVDIRAAHHFYIRVGQLDYLMTDFNSPHAVRFVQNNFRYSGGFVFRF
jgi:hypothetical protein